MADKLTSSTAASTATQRAQVFVRGGNRKHLKIDEVSLTGKRIIVSGANSGIGREASLAFARWGANVILACRQPRPSTTHVHPATVADECQKAARDAGHPLSTVEWWEVDFANLESIEAFAKRWLETGRPLDVLCDNAGVASSPGGSETFLTKDGFEIIYQTNFLSHALLTLRLLPSLAKSSDPRVICTSSVMNIRAQYDLANANGEKGGGGVEGIQFYCNSKLYFLMWATELQQRLKQSDKYKHITINNFHPGVVFSGIWAASRDGWIPWLGALTARTMVSLTGISAQQGSVPMLYLATSNDEAVKAGGNYFNRIWLEKTLPIVHDPTRRGEVWQLADQALNLSKRQLKL